jgi:hypothetical protein
MGPVVHLNGDDQTPKGDGFSGLGRSGENAVNRSA